MSSIPSDLHTTTWDYFALCLPSRLLFSPKVVKEVIVTDINDLVQEFWRLSSDGAGWTSFSAMYRLHGILQEYLLHCLDISEVCYHFRSSDLADKNLQLEPQKYELDGRLRAQSKMLLDGYRKMLDQSFSKSKDLDDILSFLRILPGVVVQKPMSFQVMADIYRIKPNLLERLIKSAIGPLSPPRVSHGSCYTLDDYLSGFLQDRDRSQLYYCDPMLQHISICRHFLCLLNGSSGFDLQS